MVEVFRTNVQADTEANELKTLLRGQFPGSVVSFDLEDCDKVLRVEGILLDAEKVMTLLQGRGYECSLLD